MSDFRTDFIRFAIEQQVLLFGEYKTKAGRLSPYFFNAGLFHDGNSLWQLTQFYAKAIQASGLLGSCWVHSVARRSRACHFFWAPRSQAARK